MEEGNSLLHVGSGHGSGSSGGSVRRGKGGRRWCGGKVQGPKASSGRVVASEDGETMAGDGDALSSEAGNATVITKEVNGQKQAK